MRCDVGETLIDETGMWDVLGGLAARGEHHSRFVERVVAWRDAGEIACVGDRVDNDVAPARATGMLAVHIRRGPWGHLREPPLEALGITSPAEPPATLDV